MSAGSPNAKQFWCRECGEEYPGEVVGRPNRPCACGGNGWRRRPPHDRVIIEKGEKKHD